MIGLLSSIRGAATAKSCGEAVCLGDESGTCAMHLGVAIGPYASWLQARAASREEH